MVFPHILDPTMVFCLFCLIVPLFKEASTTHEERIAFLTDPLLLGSFGLLIALAFLVRITGKCVELNVWERARARWYLWNGAIIHIMMDGGVGALKKLPLFRHQYKILDARFNDDDAITVPVLVGLVEIFVMAPLCFLTYYAYRRGSSWRYPMEVMICTCHIFGTIMFCLPEHLEGFKNIETDFDFEFTLHKITYFWFGYGANFIWIVLPLCFLSGAFKKCCLPQNDSRAQALVNKRK